MGRVNINNLDQYDDLQSKQKIKKRKKKLDGKDSNEVKNSK